MCKTVEEEKGRLDVVLCCRHTGALGPNDTSVDVNIKTFKTYIAVGFHIPVNQV